MAQDPSHQRLLDLYSEPPSTAPTMAQRNTSALLTLALLACAALCALPSPSCFVAPRGAARSQQGTVVGLGQQARPQFTALAAGEPAPVEEDEGFSIPPAVFWFGSIVLILVGFGSFIFNNIGEP
uniref:Uncharacterized protein n=1 Tax=Alexandrium catenella TaxID=2925 RepID=A0A7S1S5Z0_ALECA